MTQLVGPLKELVSTRWRWRRDIRRRIRRFNRLEVRQRLRGEVEPGEPMSTKHPLAYDHPASSQKKKIEAEFKRRRWLYCLVIQSIAPLQLCDWIHQALIVLWPELYRRRKG